MWMIFECVNKICFQFVLLWQMQRDWLLRDLLTPLSKVTWSYGLSRSYMLLPINQWSSSTTEAHRNSSPPRRSIPWFSSIYVSSIENYECGTLSLSPSFVSPSNIPKVITDYKYAFTDITFSLLKTWGFWWRFGATYSAIQDSTECTWCIWSTVQWCRLQGMLCSLCGCRESWGSYLICEGWIRKGPTQVCEETEWR